MKKIIIFFTFIIFVINCKSQDNNIVFTASLPECYKYEIDTIKWHLQKKSAFLHYIKDSLKREIELEENQIIAIYSLDNSSFNYPFIMISEFYTSENPPRYDQMEKDLNLITVPEYTNNVKSIYSLNSINLIRPVLIREKNLILSEILIQYVNYNEFYIRTAIFFKKNKFINVQISYINGLHNDALKDFNLILDTIKL